MDKRQTIIPLCCPQKAVPLGIEVDCFTTVTIMTKLANEQQMDQPQQAQANPRQRAVADEDGKKISPRAEIGRVRQDVTNLVRIGFVTVRRLEFCFLESIIQAWTHCAIVGTVLSSFSFSFFIFSLCPKVHR